MNDNLEQSMTLWPGSALFVRRANSESGFEVWGHGKLDLIRDVQTGHWRCQCGGTGTTGWHAGPDLAFHALGDKASEWAATLAAISGFMQVSAQGTKHGYEPPNSAKQGDSVQNRTSMCGFRGEGLWATTDLAESKCGEGL